MSKPFCREHPNTAPVCPACVASLGGKATKGLSTKAKQESSRANGKLGGRPKLTPHNRVLHNAVTDSHFKKRLEQCAGCRARTDFKARAS